MPYLDHAGASLASEEQLREIGQLLNSQRLSNPHSHHPTSTVTKQIVDNARQRILSHFNAKDYTVIFTYNSTHSLRLLAESFIFPEKTTDSCELIDKLSSNPSFGYLADSHHSVVGMREIVRSKIDHVSCLQSVPEEIPLSNGSLFVLTAMSNFCGLKYDLKMVKNFQDKGWFVGLDAAGWVSSSPLELSLYCPDFVVVSFYKLFGYPTGLGALLVRNESAHKLQKTYFGGGAVSAILPSQFVVQHRESLEEKFEDGTINYYGIASLQKGFDDLERYGGISSIQKHSFEIAQSAYDMLKNKFHWNGKPAAVIYRRGTTLKSQGPVVTFNLLREDGSFVGYAEVAKMSDLFGLDLRTGCFCNIGACQAYLKLSDEEVLANIKTGKRCGDEEDIINGKPTGAVRVSFGRQSRQEDVDALEQMLDYCFLGQRAVPFEVNDLTISSYRPVLNKIFCYPVKSCRGFEVKSSLLTSTGLQHDRRFMVVNNSITMSQKKYPQLCRIQTRVQKDSLILSAEKDPDLTVSLSPPQANGIGRVVCSSSVSTVDCGKSAGDWLSGALEMSNCRLQAVTEDSERSLSNQAPYLLANEASAQVMANQIGLTLKDVLSRFRPNLIVRGIPAFIEDSLERFRIGEAEFEVIEKCTRCEMICVHQDSGEKDPRIIVALRDLRDRQKMTFGVYVRQLNPSCNRTISSGDLLKIL